MNIQLTRGTALCAIQAPSGQANISTCLRAKTIISRRQQSPLITTSAELRVAYRVFMGIVRSNQSLEWTSTTWPRYAQRFIIASRGQLVPAPQLQR